MLAKSLLASSAVAGLALLATPPTPPTPPSPPIPPTPRAPVQDKPQAPRAFIDGTGPGWRAMTQDEFTKVNCPDDTFTWNKDGLIQCSGKPVGVIRTKQQLENFELVVQWRHLKSAGNSGVFIWAMPASIENLAAGKGRLPDGIEVQVLDHGYAERWEKERGSKPDWFTCHGDVFSTGKAKMQPFPPMSPNKRRSFPSKNLSQPVGQWNHYYIRCINGEVRLWVNGEEVSGGTACQPAKGYLCLESEGSPLEFRGLRIRELP